MCVANEDEALLHARKKAWRPALTCAAYLILLIFAVAGAAIYPQTEPAAQTTLSTVPQPAQPVPSSVGPLSIERERGLKPKDSFKECLKCPEMIVVPAGNFVMGSPATEKGRDIDENPQHRVTIARPFAVARFDLTFDEWDACVADGGCDGYRPQDQGWGRGRRPVINVSLENAMAYVTWVSRNTGKTYRLLTESEWEYAARAGSTTAYYWGKEIGTGNANCNGCGSKWDNDQTSPVGSFSANAFGLYDMAGNLWQWVQDCYHDNYYGASTDGSAVTSGDCPSRVIRGGSWISNPSLLRSAGRFRNTATSRSNLLGFRVARTFAP
jgi:formylglycine-generating enzyme required for sulfatase activity